LAELDKRAPDLFENPSKALWARKVLSSQPPGESRPLSKARVQDIRDAVSRDNVANMDDPSQLRLDPHAGAF